MDKSSPAKSFDFSTSLLGQYVNTALTYRTPRPLQIEVGSRALKVVIVGVPKSVEIKLPMAGLSGKVGGLIDTVSSVKPRPVIALTIADRESSTPSSVLKQLADSSCPITSLHLLCRMRDTNRYIKFLAKPRKVNGKLRWPLPDLTSLAFDDCNPDPDALVKMIRERYDRPDSEEEMVTKKRNDAKILPARLKYLQITGFNTLDEDSFEELEDLVGDIVEWDNPEDEDDEVGSEDQESDYYDYL